MIDAIKAWYRLGVWQHAPTKREIAVWLIQTGMTAGTALFPLLLTLFTMYYPNE